jgi:iron(III) transport system permease protein
MATKRKINWQLIILCSVAGLVVYLVIFPLGMLIYTSFRTVGPGEPGPFTAVNYIRAYLDRETYSLLFNTFLFAAVALGIGLTVGVFFAWLVERTNAPLRNLAFALIPLTVAIPSMLYAISWVLLLSPHIGVVNVGLKNLLGLENVPFNPYSIVGMGFVEGLRIASTTFLMVVGVFRSMDPSLEEAASASGASTFIAMRRITMRLMLPGILSAAIYCLTTAFDTFDIPAVMGMPRGIYVFSTKIYEASHSVPRDYGMVSTYSVILLCFACLWIYLYGRATRHGDAYATVTGKGYRPRVTDLGRLKYLGTAAFLIHFLIVIVAPLFIMIWGSLLPAYQVPSMEALSKISLESYKEILILPYLGNALKNTLIMLIYVPTLTVLISAVVAWIVVRTQVPGRKMLDAITFIPHGMPSIVLALAVMWLYLRMPFIPIYGTLWIIILAFITRYLAYGTRSLSSAMIQIHRELEEAAQLSGASWVKTFTRVTLPLIFPSLIAVWIWIGMHVVRELSISIMLYSPDSRVLSVLIWDLWQNGDVSYTCAIGVMLIGFLGFILFIGRRWALHKSRQY